MMSHQIYANDHCIIDGMYFYCQEYAQGWNRPDARKSCRFARGSFRSGSCPDKNRNGACKNKSLTKNRIWWQKYYNKTWTQMSYASMKTVCKGNHDPKTNIAEWIDGDPKNPNVKPFDPATQFPFEKLADLRKGSRVMAPKDNSFDVYPAQVSSKSRQNRKYIEIKFSDGKSIYLNGAAKLQRYYWEVGTGISCYNTFKGYQENGTIKQPGNTIFDEIEVEFDSGVTIKMPSGSCKDREKWKHKNGPNPFYRKNTPTNVSKKPVKKPVPQKPVRKPDNKKPSRTQTNSDDELDKMEDELNELEKELNDI